MFSRLGHHFLFPYPEPIQVVFAGESADNSAGENFNKEPVNWSLKFVASESAFC